MHVTLQVVGEKLNLTIKVGGPVGTCCYDVTSVQVNNKGGKATVADLKLLRDKLNDLFK